jgi:GTP cyclohydrolase I
MLKTTTLLNAFGRDFPKHLAKRYEDYVGLMCGKLPKQLNKIAIVLDMEPQILPELIKEKPDLILTHHPLIYGPKKTVLKNDETKRQLVKTLEKHRLPVYSLHTNFDAGRGGMNDALALALGLSDITPWQADPLARGGLLKEPMTRETFAKFVKKTFGLPYVFLIPEGKEMVQRVGLIGGGGAKYYTLAQAEGYDIFLSGDSAHHVRRGIVNAKYNYLEVPHEVETIFIPTMANYLKKLDSSLTLITHLTQALPQLF